METLPSEHAYLRDQITGRALRVLRAADAGRWPHGELTALAGYLSAELIRQVTDEERLIFPDREHTPELSRLARDHARLRACVDVIAGAARGSGTRSPATLSTIVRDLLAQLDHHFAIEQLVLATPGGRLTSTAALGAHPHRWYTLTEGPAVDLDAIPARDRLPAVRDRLHRLGRGEQLDLCSGADPGRLFDRLAASAGGYRFTYLACGPDQWRIRVAHRLER